MAELKDGKAAEIAKENVGVEGANNAENTANDNNGVNVSKIKTNSRKKLALLLPFNIAKIEGDTVYSLRGLLQVLHLQYGDIQKTYHVALGLNPDLFFWLDCKPHTVVVKHLH